MDAEKGALPGRGFKTAFAAERLDPLLHALHADAFLHVSVDTPAVIGDGEGELRRVVLLAG